MPVKEPKLSKVVDCKRATLMKNDFNDWFSHCCRTVFWQNTSQCLPVCAA